jgi:pimeloyl-ACP methyl ester carboxylesterase
MVQIGLTRDRDVIVMGQRGSAFAKPSLTCPEVDEFTIHSADLLYDVPSTGARTIAASKACHDRLAAAGIDLGAFNTTESAADFADLRTALRIAQWNVYGVSYGTDLALTYMREHPEGVRSATIDSVVPPNRATLGLNWTSAGGGLRNLFRACREQARCNRAYPRLSRKLSRAVNALERRPIRGTVKPGLPDQPVPTGTKAVKSIVDGGAFMGLMIAYTEVAGPIVPKTIAGIASGDKQIQREVLAAYAATKNAHAGVFSYGLLNGVVCSEWVPYEPQSAIAATGRQQFPSFPQSVLAQAPQFAWQTGICNAWPVPKAPEEQRAVTNGPTPTLVIAGSFDAITAPQVARSTAEPLPNSTFVSIPGVGHYVVPKSACARSVMASFLADPARPDTACVARLKTPAFDVPAR